MLKRLQIRNYAIIDEINIDFSSRLNIITGETGAGKSILMGALSLILGDRADSSILLKRDKKCFVEGLFDISGRPAVKSFIQDQDLDADDELVIRREIAVSGKSRAFINDSPVNLEVLREISSMLVDLHRQFDTLQLGDAGFQREVVDALANNESLLTSYRNHYRQLIAKRAEIKNLHLQKEQFNKEYDFNKYLFDELEEAAFRDNEIEEIESDLKLLSNSEAIKTALNKIAFQFNEGEQPVVQQLKTILNQLHGFSSYHAGISDVEARLQSVHIELDDIASEIDRINDQVTYDPVAIEKLNERISLGYKLFKKHGVTTTRALNQIQSELSAKLEAVMNIDEDIARMEKDIATTFDACRKIADQLSLNRSRQQKPLEEKVNKLLHQVGMPNARLKVQIDHVDLNEKGADTIEFLFDANRSNRFESVRKVASGGELSRLMLCIKSLVAQSVDLATLIFDEIDTGISGEAARQVGIIMKGLATSRQLIAITHQPQIAGKADQHLFVYKEIKGEQIHTGIRILNDDERITTIARMLSGEKPTAAALENAREMMN